MCTIPSMVRSVRNIATHFMCLSWELICNFLCQSFLPPTFFLKLHLSVCVCVCVFTHQHKGVHMETQEPLEVRGQLSGVDSLLPPYGN